MAIIQPYHANLYAHVKALKYQASAQDIKATTRHTLVLFASATRAVCGCVFSCLYCGRHRRHVDMLLLLGFVLMPTCCRHRRHVYLRVIYFANTLFVRSQCGVCCVFI